MGALVGEIKNLVTLVPSHSQHNRLSLKEQTEKNSAAVYHIISFKFSMHTHTTLL